MNDNMPDLMGSMNNQELNGNNSKKEKKEIKLGVGILIIAIISVIIIGVIYLLVFNKSDDKKDETNPSPTATPSQVKDEELSVNDSEVQRLYGYIKDTVIQEELYNGNKIKITSSELTDVDKHQIAYRLITKFDKTISECEKYPDSISYYHDQTVNGGNYVCAMGVTDMREVAPNGCMGDSTKNIKYDDRKNNTHIFPEDLMRGKVEIIFGENSYKPASFSVKEDREYNRYNYDSPSKQYVHLFYVEACGGTGGQGPTKAVISALKTANNIQIVEQITERISDGNMRDFDLKIRHVFKNVNGKYFYDYSETI